LSACNSTRLSAQLTVPSLLAGKVHVRVAGRRNAATGFSDEIGMRGACCA
jgi:hypothetical protein